MDAGRGQDGAVVDAIRELAAARLDPPGGPIDLDRPLADVTDSLGLSILVAALEGRFDVAIADRDVARIRTLRDLARLVEARRPPPPSA
jgi:acyl carrier protein